ncbi:hypothetical protein CPB83DRAFT_411570 [Crepidotus variabilis]|uniref:Uncharacterized protein n=1 Tax=Crepidotus variabilis TaxID=179855 RepID=A0A9P6JVF1_9AGAR|nr:hypothetical protein CPB83DRAFT_411570 [Crepidotus variabilis]
MILDSDLPSRPSLLSLPIEVLQDILELAVHEKHALPVVESTHPADGFELFYSRRKANQKSSYRIRFVCKQIDEVIVKYLFREVKIGFGWNYLYINPPIQELIDGAMGRVFRENARVLTLDQIILQNPPRFEDDRHRDHEYNQGLPTEVWYHYPEPMTKDEKDVRYKELMEEVHQLLPAAMASMSNLVEIQCRLDMQSSAHPLGVTFSNGLSGLSTIETLKIRAQVPNNDYRSEKASVGKYLQAIGGMKNLHTFEFSVSSRRHYLCGLNDLWPAFQAAGIRLRSISVDDVSQSMLEYLVSFTGLQRLALSPLPTDPGDIRELMLPFLFNNVVVRHSRTLSHLAVTGEGQGWCINQHHTSALARCRSLESLTTPLWVLNQKDDFNFLTPLEFIFEFTRTLPSLRQLVLKLTGSNSTNHWRMEIAPQVLLSVHNAVTSIEHSEVSLVPEVLTIQYDRLGSVEYRLVELQLGSGATTWRYYGEKQAWMMAPLRLPSERRNRRGDSFVPVPEDLKRQMEQQERDRIAGRVTYAVEKKAKGVLPGQF